MPSEQVERLSNVETKVESIRVDSAVAIAGLRASVEALIRQVDRVEALAQKANQAGMDALIASQSALRAAEAAERACASCLSLAKHHEGKDPALKVLADELEGRRERDKAWTARLTDPQLWLHAVQIIGLLALGLRAWVGGQDLTPKHLAPAPVPEIEDVTQPQPQP